MQIDTPRLCSKLRRGSQNDYTRKVSNSIIAVCRVSKTHLVPQPKLLLAQFHAPTNALRDTKPLVVHFAGKLETHTAEARATCSVNAQTRSKLGNDRPKVARLETRGTRQRAANILSVRVPMCELFFGKKTYFPCMGSQIHTTPCPDFCTAAMCPAR